MEMSFDKFDPERLLPESVRPEIYGLAVQNNPNLIDSAQNRLRRYIDEFEPKKIYEDVDKPSRASIAICSALGLLLTTASLQSEETVSKILYGGFGLYYTGTFVYLSMIRHKTKEIEPELSKEARRFLYLKFFEKQKL